MPQPPGGQVICSSHYVAGLHMSTQGASGTVGYGSRTDTQSASSNTYTPSVVASTGGNLNIGAKDPVKIDGSVVAAAKDLGISGSSVAFTTEQNSTTQTVMHKDKSIGLTGHVSPNSVAGQIINTALAATQTSGKGGPHACHTGRDAGGLSCRNGHSKGSGHRTPGLANTNPADRDSGNIELAGVQAGIGLASNKRSVTQTDTTVVGSTATACGTLSVVARGDNASDKTNGDLSAVAAQLAGQDVVLAAQKDKSLSAGWNNTDSDSRMSSNNAFVGVDAGVGTSGAGVSVTASVGLQNQHVTTSSRTAVDTTVKAGNSVTLSTPGAMTLNGAEVSGPRVDVSAGSLSITSPQNTSDYKSTARQTSALASVRIRQRLFQITTEHFKIHCPGKRFELITKPAQASQALFNIKETGLLHLPYPNQRRKNGITKAVSKPEVFSNPPPAR